MFDIGISELMIIMVVALVVIGPERLPKVARTLGHLWGRAQRYVNGVKADIERDMAVEEFRQLQQKVQAEASAAEASFKQGTQDVDKQMREIDDEFSKLSSSAESAQAAHHSPVNPPSEGSAGQPAAGKSA